MLAKSLPLIITAVAIFLAIALHWFDKKRFLLPCALSALGSSVVAGVGFYFLASEQQVAFPWSGLRFAFISSFVVALLIGYLMKHLPDFFSKR